jgi:hypothetical protein
MSHPCHCPCPLCVTGRNAELLERCWRLDPPSRVVTAERPEPPPTIIPPTAEQPTVPTPVITGLMFILLAAALVVVALPVAFHHTHR